MERCKTNAKKEGGITLIALVITIIVLLILAAISIATLTGENGVLTKANTAKKETEIEETKEQAKLDIAAWTANKLSNGESADLNDSLVKEILTDKEYVKDQPGDTSFKTVKNGYEIPYSDLYTKEDDKKYAFTINGVTCYFSEADDDFLPDDGESGASCLVFSWLKDHVQGLSINFQGGIGTEMIIFLDGEEVDYWYNGSSEPLIGYSSAFYKETEFILKWSNGELVTDIEQRIH